MHKIKPIFICDDSDDDALLIKVMLSAEGFETKIFNSGLALLSFLEVTHKFPALIIIDLKMPVLGGLEVIQCLKKSNKFQSVPIMLVTGMDVFDIENNGHIKVDYFIRKPIDINILSSKIKEILQIH
ncbi:MULTISPECIES: response regulator [Calothrix]|uniref:Response regulator n=2 Tax=Calothrix TaxID=1186 RepID=A0ABR8AN66_9CYAN|nr:MULTISPECIES: response regulator [Calothrix]MBD2200650.1 response regulator [Calothrix parietina FACHB-288]MBD2229701.1 response regulator [Calothrix anomala FACHB-343]